MVHQMFRWLSPPGARAKLSTLIFHRVLPEPDPLFPGEIDAKSFDAICGWLRQWFNVLPLDEAIRRMREGQLPARACAITFDDGYADNHDVAMPLLQRHGLCATFFIATGFLDGGRMWNDTLIEAVRRSRAAELALSDLLGEGFERVQVQTVEKKRAAIGQLIDRIKYLELEERVRLGQELARRSGATLPEDLMMRSEQVQGLRAGGMQIGAHTVSHPILARLDDAQAREEIGRSKSYLENLLQERVPLFAYPNGKPAADYSPRSVELAREAGFDAAVSTSWGVAHAATDLFQIPRFTPWDRSKFRFAARMAHNYRRL
jgi:peptidoglycan/xylan/chitin deacetylase (PgdA/CDA1 family)